MDISVLMAKVFKSIKCGCYFQINSCIYGHAQRQNQFPNHISRVPCCFWRVHPLTNGSYGKWTLGHMQAKSCNTPSLFFKMDWYTPFGRPFQTTVDWWLQWRLELVLWEPAFLLAIMEVGIASGRWFASFNFACCRFHLKFSGRDYLIIYHGWMNVIYIHMHIYSIHIYIYTYYILLCIYICRIFFRFQTTDSPLDNPGESDRFEALAAAGRGQAQPPLPLVWRQRQLPVAGDDVMTSILFSWICWRWFLLFSLWEIHWRID